MTKCDQTNMNVQEHLNSKVKVTEYNHTQVGVKTICRRNIGNQEGNTI